MFDVNYIIDTKSENCIGCNRCVRECPMETANIAYEDEEGNVRVKTDHTKCVACGRCVITCKHDARFFRDDTENFFEDLASGVPISIIVAPAVRTNIPEWKRLFTYLKRLGVKKFYDTSLGADLCIWANIRHIQQTDDARVISQPCPVIVTYCEKYQHSLLEKLSPMQSPMGCLCVYMKEYEGIEDSIAAFSPCIAKSNEFAETGLAQYNITFEKLAKYLKENGVELPDEETDFDHYECGLGSLFPMPGGYKENIEFFLGKSLNIAQSEGYDVFERLDEYAETSAEFLPDVYDVLNCYEGCNVGSACSYDDSVFKIDKLMHANRVRATDDRNYNYFDELYKQYDKELDLSLFTRGYVAVDTELPDLSDEDIAKAFVLLDKTTEEDQSIDCGACGSDTCHEMARRIALGINIPINCMVKALATAREEHEINLNTLEQMETIWAHVESGIAIIDEETRLLLDVNPAAVRLFGSGAEDMIGVSCYDFFGQHECPITDMNQKLDRAERQFKKADGTVIPVLKTVSKILYKGRPALLESFTDISSFKNAEEKGRMLEVAEQANKAKSAFLANMSHEIRTPMNAILGIADIQLQNDNLAPSIKEALSKIHNSGDLLLGIINDILDLSKIEAGKLELAVDNYDTASLINDTVQLNIMRIGNKPIEFVLNVDEDTPSNMLGDELRIKQILNNMLSNAFKYTSEGTVTLDISCEAGDRKNPNIVMLNLCVTDTGQGMTSEQVSKLFDEYSRFNMQANRTTEGTGLGMSITQNLIRMMSGELYVESVPGEGTKFTALLPQLREGSGVLGKELAENLKQFREGGRAQMKKVQITRDPMPYGSVLVVDDVETNIYVATGLLTPYGIKVDSADSGFAAIKKIEDGNVYDIVFMDHMMPKMDGIEATGIIREMGYSDPIVALTANAVVGQADIFLHKGFDDFISKPIDIRQLNTVLNKLIRDKQPPEVIEKARQEAAEAAEAAAAAAAKAEGAEGPGAGAGAGTAPASAAGAAGLSSGIGQPQAEEAESDIDPKFAEIFVRDAKKALAVLEEIDEKKGNYSEEDMRAYIINTHGMKSALANMGQEELSFVAKGLEQAGRDGAADVMESQTPGFLSSLRALVEKLEPDAGGDEVPETDEDPAFLREKLLLIRDACDGYDAKAANAALKELQERAWSKATGELLAGISVQLLHSDFEEAVAAIDAFTDGS